MDVALTDKVSVLYEKRLAIKGVYRFKDSLSISNFVTGISDLLKAEKIYCKAKIYSEFGYVKISDFNKLKFGYCSGIP